jgi:hypothetical protein
MAHDLPIAELKAEGRQQKKKPALGRCAGWEEDQVLVFWINRAPSG